MLLGAEEESPAQGALLEDLPLSASLTLLAQEGDRAWLVFNGPLESRVLLADAATGEVLAVREGGPVAAAFLRGGSLILCENRPDQRGLHPALPHPRGGGTLGVFSGCPPYCAGSTSPLKVAYTL